MKESSILYESGRYWVTQIKGLFYVMCNGVTHAESVGGVGWQDKSVAIAYCQYRALRDSEVQP